MPQNCFIPGCNGMGEITVLFPNAEYEPERFAKWLKALSIKGYNEAELAIVLCKKRVCLRHFSKDQLTFPQGKLRLRSDAVPNLYLGHRQSDYLAGAGSSTSNADAFVPEVLEPANTPLLVMRQETVDSLENLSNVSQCLFDAYKTDQTKFLSLDHKAKLREIFGRDLDAAKWSFILKQIKDLAVGPVERTFSLKLCTLALSLYKQSPNAYPYLQQHLYFPPRRRLLTQLGHLTWSAGLQGNAVFHRRFCQEIKALPSGGDARMCALLYDEVRLRAHAYYDAQLGHIVGFQEGGGAKRALKYADWAFVFMVAAVCADWRQPIGYVLCERASRADYLLAALKTMVQGLEEAGLDVVATVGSPRHAKVMRRLVGEGQFFYSASGRRVAALFDTAQLFRGIRDSLVAKDLTFKLESQVEKKMRASWRHLVELYEENLAAVTTMTASRRVNKLTHNHIYLDRKAKIDNRLCLEALSQTVASEMLLGHRHGDMRSTGLLFKTLDNLFDSLNGGDRPDPCKPIKGLLRCSSPHLRIWAAASTVLQTVEFADGGKTPRSVALLQHNLTALAQLFGSLEVGQAVTLRRLQLDPLVNFLADLTALGRLTGRHTPAAFVSAYKTLMVTGQAGLEGSPYRSCEDGDAAPPARTLVDFQDHLLAKVPRNDTPNLARLKSYRRLFVHDVITGLIVLTLKKLGADAGTCDACRASILDLGRAKEVHSAYLQFCTIFSDAMQRYVLRCKLYDLIVAELRGKANFPIVCRAHDFNGVFVGLSTAYLLRRYVFHINEILKGMVCEVNADRAQFAAMERYRKLL